MNQPSEKELATLLAERFCQRRDVIAVYGRVPKSHSRKRIWHPEERKLRGSDLVAHLRGETALGTYLVDHNGLCRFVTLDLDFNTTGASYRVDMETITRKLTSDPDTPDEELQGLWPDEPEECNPRDVWLDLEHPLRPWLAFQVRCLAAGLAWRLRREYSLDVGVAYSGGKGIHVHAWFEPRPAPEARFMANKMMASWMDYRDGSQKFDRVNGFSWRDKSDHYKNITVEVFPKQDEISEEGFGNLVRLPLGIHPVTGQRSYFIDLDSIPAWTPLAELDPLVGLKRGSTA